MNPYRSAGPLALADAPPAWATRSHPDHALRLIDRPLAADRDFELIVVAGAGHRLIDCLHYFRERAWTS